MAKKKDILILLGMFLAAISLPLATRLVSQPQDDRSQAAEAITSSSQVSFKLAFKGVKSNYTCLSSLTKIKLEIANVPTNTYESNINASITPVSGETNTNGDQVFLVSNLALDSKFNSVNNFNYLRVKGPSHLASRMCLNHQTTKLDEITTCDINLSNTNTTVYDFTNYALIPGDINQDGMINSTDYSIVKNNFNSSSEITCNQTGDLNLDGIVNSLDANLLKDSLSKQEEGFIMTSTITPNPTRTPTEDQILTDILLKISVMADIHNNTSGLKRMMEKAKNRGSSLVVLAGDLSENGLKKELTAVKKAADSINLKYAAIPGNHDERKTYFDDVFGKKYQSIRFDNYKAKILLINDSYSKGLGNSQKKWLENEMPECQQITCMIIMHMPLNHPTSDLVWGKYSSVNKKDAEWLKKMIVNNQIKKVVTGHIHQVKNYTLGGFETQIVSPIKGSKPVYGEFLFNNGQITTTIVSDATN